MSALVVCELSDERRDASPIREVFRRVADRVLSNCCLSEVRGKDLFPTANDVISTEMPCNVGPYSRRHVRASDFFLIGEHGGSLWPKARLSQEQGSAASYLAVNVRASLPKGGGTFSCLLKRPRCL